MELVPGELAFERNRTGKIRIAISGDLWRMMQQHYLLQQKVRRARSLQYEVTLVGKRSPITYS